MRKHAQTTIAVLLLALLQVSAQVSGPGEWNWRADAESKAWQRKLAESADVRVWDGVAADRRTRTIEILAETTGISAGIETEFLLIGAKSDRAYEAVFVSKNDGDAVLQAAEFIGVAKGRPVNPRTLVFHPRGERFTVEVRQLKDESAGPVGRWIQDTRDPECLARGFTFTGGEDWKGTTIPAAIVSLYNEPCSMFDLPFQAAKGVVYGRFRAARKAGMHEKVALVLKFLPTADGGPRSVDKVIAFGPDAKVADVVRDLRAASEAGHDLFVTVKADDAATMENLRALAKVLTMLDAADGTVRLDRPGEGEFYPNAFLPEEGWRVRTARPFQPWELHLGPTNRFVFVGEDWTGPGLEPKLLPREFVLNGTEDLAAAVRAVDDAEKPMDTLLIFCSSGTPAGEIRKWVKPYWKRLPKLWIFTEETK